VADGTRDTGSRRAQVEGDFLAESPGVVPPGQGIRARKKAARGRERNEETSKPSHGPPCLLLYICVGSVRPWPRRSPAIIQALYDSRVACHEAVTQRIQPLRGCNSARYLYCAFCDRPSG